MRVEVTGRRMRVTPSIREHAEARLDRLSRFFDQLTEARVTASVQRGQHIAEVMLNADGLLFRAEERTNDLYVAIDQAADKLERQLLKFKERLQQRSRGGVRVPEAVGEEGEPAAEAETTEPEIVRTKQVPMKPMTPEEAALQMEMLHHDFFVFRNGETEQVNVIYRRRDGNYGLIEPEAGTTG